ncbi:MAG TPA: penicillin-binding transpeptidase domain-containing protein [Prosthecobacter sp.]|nr:penicillin-binding transpeptidase domain-containing protein [Prosthecobacter sp.]
MMTILAGSWARAEQGPAPEAPVLSDSASQPFYFSIPAPRGQILDSQGQPLARNRVVQRLTLRVPPLPEETPDAYVGWVQEYWPTVIEAFPDAVRPEVELLKQQFEHRRRIPLVISEALSIETVAAVPERPEFIDVRTEYARDYPGGSLAAHVLGYVTANGAPLRGPLQHGEPLWREVQGRQGLEASLNAELAGHAGLMVVSYDKEGRVVQRHVLRPPVPGRDVVTTLQLQMQQSVEKALKSAKRPGAMVVVDASSGGIVAMASEPTFDPGLFVRGLDKASFETLAKGKNQPLFNRAASGLYPPGSVFKPFVALAGLRNGRIGAHTLIPCGPELVVEGRMFKNWTDKDNGLFDVKGALVRSFNTYFYQAAIAIGDQPILTTAREFGFGQPIDLPLGGVATGELPKRVPSHQGLANLSIGQSPLLSSPLEVAMAMATLADGLRRPKARLVGQVQDQEGNVLTANPPSHANEIRYPTEAMITIHNAMYGVVNHVNGTAAKARVPGLRVYGKTGTAQWSRDGEMVNAVWFAGFIKDSDPPLAFAVALEGEKGERVFGGAVAAPVAGKVLSEVAAKPATFALRTRKVKAPVENYTLAFNSDIPVPPMSGMPVRQTVAAALLPPAVPGGAAPATPQRSAVVAVPPQGMASYYGDYPHTAPPAPLPPPPPPYSPPHPSSMRPAQPDALAYDSGIAATPSGPRHVRRAIPVEEVVVPDAFFDQPPPEANFYYERARPLPRTNSNTSGTGTRPRFIFPGRR